MTKRKSVLSPYLSHARSVTKPSVRSKTGIVVTHNRAASEVGARVLKEGGHAVDAAVAAAMTVGVVEPWMSGIGGVGAMLVRDGKSGAITAYDFGAVSPRALDPADYPLLGGADQDLFGWPQVAGQRNTVGATSMCAPTQPRGLAAAHERFGRKRWRDLLAPAIEHAEAGLTVDWHAMLMITSGLGGLRRNVDATRRFLRNDLPPQPPFAAAPEQVVRLDMPDLVRTLRALADDGIETMYTGPIARSIVGDVAALGGCLSLDDMKLARIAEFKPREISYRDRTIYALPELNGGTTLAVAFAELRQRASHAEHYDLASATVAYAEALRSAWDHRFRVLGDAGERVAPSCTTHVSVVDRDGNMVTLTQTLLSLFGSSVVLPGSGILMNNGINWFNPSGGPNGLAPGRHALANYTPAIMTGGGETVAIGGSGGRKIIPAVFQLLAMIADLRLDLNAAWHRPRIDVSGGPNVVVDRRLDERTKSALAQHFDIVDGEPTPFPFPFTIASAVRRSGDDNEGATEPEHAWSEAVSEEMV